MANDGNHRPPTPTDRNRAPAPASTRSEIDSFLDQVKGLAPSAVPGRRGG